MKKLIFLSLICSTMIFLLSGCPKPYTPPPEPPVTGGGDTLRGPTTADFTLHAKCKNGKFVCGSDLTVEIVFGQNSEKFECSNCSTIPLSFVYNGGSEKNYYVKMTAHKGGGSETQGLSLRSVMKSADYPVVIYAFDNWLCDCKDTTRPDNQKGDSPIKVKQTGAHWDE
ncbi:hypothetical protein DRQ36_01700 [bacterium]|nr:MAG: hypothetical protein DRQ36_01700 [bacterium]